MNFDHKKIKPVHRLEGEIHPPGDKSISHRALILGSLSQGETSITGLLEAEDVKNTIQCLKTLGITINKTKNKVTVLGDGLTSYHRPKEALNAGNSGTLMRILTGALAGQNFNSRFTGDKSLQVRPMDRVINPLHKMGAKIRAREGKYPPLYIQGRKLTSISYKLPVASAQVKSCILLAGLLAKGDTKIIEPHSSRDHTERMLDYLGASIERVNNTIIVKEGDLKGDVIYIPGDFSSASFFMAAGAIVPDGQIKVREVGVNPTRIGFLTVLKRMGAIFSLTNQTNSNNEPRADITIKSSNLKGIEIDRDLIPLLIDEIPLIGVLATQAKGRTVIRNAEEARVKETDRIKATVENLKRMGGEVEEKPDGMIIKGKQKLKGGEVKAFGDHRIALAFSIAGLVASGNTIIHNAKWVNVSYPNFYKHLQELTK